MTEIRIGRDGLSVEASAAALRAAISLACATSRTLVWEGFRRRSGGFDEGEAALVRFFGEMASASVEGGAAGDSTLRFEPGTLVSGPLELSLPGRDPLVPLLGAIVLPAAAHGSGLELVLHGSTHAPAGASFETAASSWRHWMKRAGLELRLELLSAGFAPRGGGALRVIIGERDRSVLAGLDLAVQGELRALRIAAAAARLPAHVQQRQAARARSGIQIAGVDASVQLLKLRAANAGSIVAVTGVFDDAPVTVSAMPARGRSVESAGEEAAAEFRQLITTGGLVPPVLVESLVLVLALAEGPSVLSTWRLPPETLPLAALVDAFTGRALLVEGKPGRTARLRLD